MVTTAYDEYRNNLRDMLNEAFKYAANNLMSPSTWGFDEMQPDYAVKVYTIIKEARDAI